ncbi:MAG: DUF971 domain-containing protein [Chloroflexi bacterium]|nr:DUF971 domain-containing protein [Chloroflexota bacterium]
MTPLKPTGVTADKTQKQLIITWSDGHESRLPYAGLRVNCPCVECKGGHTHMGTTADLETMQNLPDSEMTIETASLIHQQCVGIQNKHIFSLTGEIKE